MNLKLRIWGYVVFLTRTCKFVKKFFIHKNSVIKGTTHFEYEVAEQDQRKKSMFPEPSRVKCY